MNSLKKLLTPPVFQDEMKTQQAFMLHVILCTLMLVPIPFVIYHLFFVYANFERSFIQSVIGEAVNIVLFIMLRRGHVRTASILQVSAFWLFFVITSYTGEGIQGSSYLLGFSLVIAIAGILLGGRGAATFTVLSLVYGIVLLSAGSLSLRSNPFVMDSQLTTWVASLVLFPVSAVLQYLSSRALRHAVARARASEERYRLISRITSDYTFSTELDADGQMQLNWVAGAFEEITGYTYDEYVATGGWRAHLYPEDLAKDKRDMEALHSNEEVVTEVRHFKKDGDLRWARVYGHPIWDATNNRLKGIVGAAKDITQQKLAEERETRRQFMLEKVIRLGKQVAQVSDLWTTLDRIWHGVHDDLGFSRLGIFLYNTERNSMDGMFGTDLEGMQIHTQDIWFPTDHGVIFKTVLDKPDGLYYTENFDVENDIPSGHEMYGVKGFAAVAVWGVEKPVAVICVDNLLTKNIITSDQLEALRLYAGYAGLAIENARLNASLQNELSSRQTFIDQLETKNAELERFTYTVSHDLKSPLVTIVGFLGYVEKDALAGNIERVKSGIKRISSAAKKMEHLLSDLLELSRIGRLMNPPENVSFAEIVDEAMDRVRGQIDANSIQVRVEDNLPMVHGDRARLVEIVQNLLDNSAKFSAGNDQPCIEIGTKGQDENLHHILFVCDNGIGIEPEFHERIFGLFNKLNPQMEGTGIGLTLVKRIIEVHGGRIWVESSPGRGAAFYFTLPAQTTT